MNQPPRVANGKGQPPAVRQITAGPRKLYPIPRPDRRRLFLLWGASLLLAGWLVCLIWLAWQAS